MRLLLKDIFSILKERIATDYSDYQLINKNQSVNLWRYLKLI